MLVEILLNSLNREISFDNAGSILSSVLPRSGKADCKLLPCLRGGAVGGGVI